MALKQTGKAVTFSKIMSLNGPKIFAKRPSRSSPHSRFPPYNMHRKKKGLGSVSDVIKQIAANCFARKFISSEKTTHSNISAFYLPLHQTCFIGNLQGPRGSGQAYTRQRFPPSLFAPPSNFLTRVPCVQVCTAVSVCLG